MLTYSRNALLSLRNWYKTIKPTTQSHGTLERPVPAVVWQKLASNNLLASRRGQRGGSHLKNHKSIKTIQCTSRRKRISTQIGANHSNLINIQVSTDEIKNRILGANLHNLSALNRTNVNTETPENKKQKSRTSLEIIHLNIRSLRKSNHLSEVRQLAHERKSDIITISESWLNTTVKSAEVNVDEYKLYRLDRLHKRGGGVCAYVRNELKAKMLSELSYISEQNFHQLWLTVQCNKMKSLVVCVTYRPDDSPVSSFEEILKPNYIQAILLNKPIVILGDLNCDGLKPSSTESRALQCFSDELNLSQLIKSPTRITETTETLLDVILVSAPKLVRKSGVINAPISDHLPVFVELKLKPPKMTQKSISIRSYKNYSPCLFTTDLACKADRLLTIFQGNNVNTKLDSLNDLLQSTLNLHAPVKIIKIKSRPCPFVNKEIKDLMRIRNQLHRRFLQTHNRADWERFKLYRNLVKNKLVVAERNHTADEVSVHKNNPSSLWKIINRVIPSRLRESPTYSKDFKSVADDFNTFFSLVGKNTALASRELARQNNITLSRTTPVYTNQPPQQPFSFKCVSCEHVRRIVLSLPLNKSPGPDKLSTHVIRDCLPVILGPLTEIINCSLSTSTFPTAWKLAEVIPLLKDGDHEVASNNRPLSLLDVLSKVCEKIVLEQFNAFLVSNKRLSPHQSGNKKHHSTETLNVFITDKMLEGMDKQKITALVLLDLSKAFDSINHERLLQKIANLGASSASVQWFKSYLSNRSQSVRIHSILSDPLPLSHGVPQGVISTYWYKTAVEQT